MSLIFCNNIELVYIDVIICNNIELVYRFFHVNVQWYYNIVNYSI